MKKCYCEELNKNKKDYEFYLVCEVCIKKATIKNK